MKKRIILLALVFIFTALFSTPRFTAASSGSGGLEVTIAVPSQIVNPEAFPIIAKATNVNSTKKIYLQDAVWKLDGKEFKYPVDHELSPIGELREKVEKLKQKQELTPEDLALIQDQTEMLQKESSYLTFNVTKEMAEEIQKKGSATIELSLQGMDSDSQKTVAVQSKRTVTVSKLQRLTYAPAGINVENFRFGDTHTHSTQSRELLAAGTGIYSIDQLKPLAQTVGLQWMVLTDHAYCLDSNTYNAQISKVTELSKDGFPFLYGEELSVATLISSTSTSGTGHMNGIMNSTFVTGVTDIFRYASTPTSQEGIDSLKGYGGLVTINHPQNGTSGLWNYNMNSYPYTHGETAMEIWNASISTTANNGSIARWIDQRLLKGEHVFPIAGSDTEDTNYLGKCYNAVYSEGLSQESIKTALSQGHHYISTGPALTIWAKTDIACPWSWMGDTITAGTGKATIYLSYAYGKDMTIYLVKGKAGQTSETSLKTITTNRRNRTSYVEVGVDVEPGCYVRAYCVETTNTGKVAYTTPIWFS